MSLIRAGSVEKPATAAARRLAEQARQQLVEYLGGKRAFFSVPVDLSEVPDFQRRVLEAGLRPFNHGDYEPGRRFYFLDRDGVEYEVVSYR